MTKQPRLEKLQSGITLEEREQLLRELDLEASEEDWERVWGPLSGDQQEALARLLAVFNETDGPVLLKARLAKVAESAGTFARFFAYALLPGGWYLSGYLAYKPTDAQVEAWKRAGLDPIPPRRVYVRHLAIEPENEGNPLTAEVLRAVKIESLITKVRAYFRVTAEAQALLEGWGIQLSPEDLVGRDERVAVARRIPPKRGSRGLPDEYFLGLALDYLAEQDGGRGVHGRLAEAYGQSEAKIRDHLNRAKKRGWLEGGEQGKLSYRPGPRLREFQATREEKKK